jgi:peptidyl-dipeptidase A
MLKRTLRTFSTSILPVIPAAALLVACSPPDAPGPVDASAAPPSAAEAEAFMDGVEAARTELREVAARTGWLAQTHITVDTKLLAGEADTRYTLATIDAASKSTRYSELELDPELRRKFDLLRLVSDLPPPNDEALASEASELDQELRSLYGTGTYCRGEECRTLDELGDVMAKSRDAAELEDAWVGWRTISPPMRPLYTRQVELLNQGARDLGFADLSDLWRSNYDMTAAQFSADMERQWELVKPLYSALQCHVRARLTEQYGEDVMGDDGTIPAHLLGNMWAQSWGNVYDLVAPEGVAASYDMNELVENKLPDVESMFKTGEAFFTSLGFDALPESFWERSQFTRPRDRQVVCHASAWDIDTNRDVRIKMCTKRNAEDFITIHHELGHNYYQMAYAHQPQLFRSSANDGFHEALGDTIALSITPDYLVQLGMLEEEPPAEEDLVYLLKLGLNKVAFLPFALVVDKWRWQVFNGELTEADYNAGWWKLREQYQGVSAPVRRSEADFDPGAKYHVPAGTPYARYFLAHIQQFQFHKALCDAIGFQGPLTRCTIFNQAEAGERLQNMMAMGASRPWQDAMEAMTGQRELDASAVVDYFAPLKTWLDEQNRGRQCGW